MSVRASVSLTPHSSTNRARRAAGSSRTAARAVGAHRVGRRDRDEVGLGEVAVVLRAFLRAHAVRDPRRLVPVPGLLHDPPAGLEQLDLAFDLVVDRAAERAQRVHVLDLDAGPERLGPRPVAPTRSRRRASSPLPSSRRTRRSPRGSRAARRRIPWPAPRCGCRAGSRSPSAARRRGCSRRGSDRRRGCGRHHRRAWSCRCPPPCARARCGCACRRPRGSRRRRSARRTATSGSPSACRGRSSSSGGRSTLAERRSGTPRRAAARTSTTCSFSTGSEPGRPETHRAHVGVRLGAELVRDSHRTAWSPSPARRGPRGP